MLRCTFTASALSNWATESDPSLDVGQSRRSEGVQSIHVNLPFGMFLAAGQRGHIESDSKVFHQHLKRRRSSLLANLSTRALRLGLSMCSVLLLLTFYSCLLLRLFGIYRVCPATDIICLLSILFHTQCVSTACRLTLFGNRHPVFFPSSVKYNHRDSPAFLPQSMEKSTGAGNFDRGCCEADWRCLQWQQFFQPLTLS